MADAAARRAARLSVTSCVQLKQRATQDAHRERGTDLTGRGAVGLSAVGWPVPVALQQREKVYRATLLV
jgi:hypothetical protein